MPVRPWVAQQNVHGTSSGADMLWSTLRYRWTIIVVSIFISAPMIAGVWTQIIPEYQARAEVRVRPIIPRLVFRTEDNGAIPFYDSFVNTQVSLIRSRTVVQRALDRDEVQQTQWYAAPPRGFLQKLRGEPDPPLERLREDLMVRPRPRTEIIDVSFTCTSGSEAKVIVDAVLEQYVTYVGERSNETEEKLFRQLVEQHASLLREIQEQEEVCSELRKSLGTAIPEQLIAGRRVYLDGLQVRMRELRNTIALLEWQAAQVEVADNNDTATAPVIAETNPEQRYYEDEEWRQLDLDARMIQHQIASSIYTSEHPEMQKLTKNLEFAQTLLRERETQLDELWRRRLGNAARMPAAGINVDDVGLEQAAMPIEYQLARAKQEEKLLREESDRQQEEFKSLLDTAELLESESSALAYKRQVFAAVRDRLEQKKMERNVPGSIDILMKAFSPSKPSQDRRAVFTAMSLVFGFGVGGGFAFLRAMRNQTVHSAKDIPLPMQTPLLGQVPLVRGRYLAGSSPSGEVKENQSRLVESIRVLRTALLARLAGQKRVTVLVTSSDAGTGKSSFTMMLGKSLASAGKKILLIDADFYKMALSRRFELLERSGFIESLNSKTVEWQTMCPTKTPNLDVMPAGTRGPEDMAPEEIANGAFKACIGQLFEQYGYDIILLDSAPVLPIADALILAGQVDGTIMVERESVSQRTHILTALDRLSSAGGRLLGTVFVGSLSREQYGYGYGYGHRES